MCGLKKILSRQHLSVLDVLDTEIKAAFCESVLYNHREFLSSQHQQITESDIRTTSPPRCLRC